RHRWLPARTRHGRRTREHWFLCGAAATGAAICLCLTCPQNKSRMPPEFRETRHNPVGPDSISKTITKHETLEIEHTADERGPRCRRLRLQEAPHTTDESSRIRALRRGSARAWRFVEWNPFAAA